MQFVLNELAGLEQVSKLPGFEEAAPDVVSAILDEAAKFATDVLRRSSRSPTTAWSATCSRSSPRSRRSFRAEARVRSPRRVGVPGLCAPARPEPAF